MMEGKKGKKLEAQKRTVTITYSKVKEESHPTFATCWRFILAGFPLLSPAPTATHASVRLASCSE